MGNEHTPPSPQQKPQPLIQVGTDPIHGPIYQSAEAIQFEATIAAFNGVLVTPSQHTKKPPSNVGGVAVLLPAGTGN